MLRRQPLLMIALGFFAITSCCNVNGQELMSADVASRLGLTNAWTASVRSPMGAQTISDLHLHVHQTDPNVYLEIIYTPDAKAAGAKTATSKTADDAAKPADSKSDTASANQPEVKVLQRIWINQKDSAGTPVGQAEAERLASNQIRRLKRRGIKATTRQVTVPRINLYSLSSFGGIECRNAENGNLIWSTRVGKRKLNFRALGIDDTRVTVINGTNLLMLDATNGEVIDEQRLNHTPIFGAVNSGDYAMVATLRGPIESYNLTNFDERPSYESASGRAITPPIKSPDSSRIAWTTDAGFFYVMELQGNPSILFRFATDGVVGGRPAAASGDRFFFGSDSGQVYGVRATRVGEVLWSTPFGEPFYTQPFLSGNALFIPSAYGNLHAIDVSTGDKLWNRSTSGVKDVVGVFGDQVYVIMTNGNLGTVNAETGQRTGEYDVSPSLYISNPKTDRMYLVNENGLVQCLRPKKAEMPTLSVQMEMTKPDESAQAKAADEGKPDGAKAADPFGAGGSDPFGAGDADPFGNNDADPFGGGGDDPFGGAMDDDPFGAGGDDPFK